MLAVSQKNSSGENNPKGAISVASPSVNLPKGGGAVRGIGEKFTTNPATGSGAMTIPLPMSQGRSGFSPQLTLNYDSGSGNGPFGLGWSLSLPSITRKTDKGLPQYEDTDESDVFILSGAEDLVVEFERDATGRLVKDQNGKLKAWEAIRVIEGEKYRVLRYRPRTEGLFSRIERWTRCIDGDTHWRSISKDNVTTLYGKREKYDGSSSVESRIVDPSAPQRVFSWLICQSYDDKGNAVSYRYVAENADGVDVIATHEINRPDTSRIVNRYLKRILYGNATSLVISGPVSPLGSDLSQMKWHFELVFDYDEKHVEPATLNNARGDIVDVSLGPKQGWPARKDAFSRYRSTFELRTYRRCKRVAMFHHFENEFQNPPVPDYLVRSLDFEYEETAITSYLTSVTSAGYVHQSDQKYLKKTLPQLQFEYSRSPLESTDTEDFPLRDLPEESLENVPAGTSSGEYQWVDLDGEGISGLLSEQANALYFKANLGSGKLDQLKQMSPQPSLAALASWRQQLLDLAGDGQVDLVEFSEPVAGFYERSEENSWESFRSFRQLPNLNWRSPDIRFTDLTGDGLADILVTEGDELTWYGSLAEDGFEAGIKLRLAADENTSPYVVTSDPTQALFLADMSGDGLNDLVRIRNSEVCYWPNLGYGRFGRKITMGNRPRFDSPDQFDPRRIHLADTDGSGVADIIYHGRAGVAIYLNQAGNSCSDVRLLESVPSAHHLSSLSTVDLLGAGTICLVWSSSLPSDTRHSMKYIDLMKSQKPHLLIRSENNLGAETAIEYASSTRFYLQDKANGTPWITRLPFPVHVVTRVETFDRISRNRFTSTYSYHHGHFDGVEREFRGFGRVEQTDTEEFGTLTASDTFPTGDNINAQSHVPPVLTRTWYHTGVYLGGEKVSKHFAEEYYREPRHLADPVAAANLLLDDTILPNDLSVEEEREACRALRGQMLRQEVYALDGKTEPSYPFGHPYAVTEQNFTVETVQPRSGNRFGIFFTHPRESISFQYERNPDDPRISHTMTFETDRFGNVLKSASIGYKRRSLDAGLSPSDQANQAKTLVVYTENRFTNFISENDILRNPVISEARTYELTGYSVQAGQEKFEFNDFVRQNAQVVELAYEAQPTGGKQRRLIEHVRTLYRYNDFSGPLALGQLESLAIPFESYKLAFTPGLLTEVFGGKVTTAMLESEGQYRHVEGDDNWWIPSGRILYSPVRGHTDAQELHHARNHFFLPCRSRDPFHTDLVGTETVIRYDEYDLLVLETEDALGNRVTAGERDANPIPTITRKTLDYRMLQASMVMDPNRNRSFVSFDALGMVVGTAVSGKPGEMSAVDPAIELGDSLEGFEPDLALSTTSAHLANPTANPQEILKKATTRLIYDLFAFHRTKDTPNLSSPVVYSLVRETHESELPISQVTKVQHSFSYSDGFGREIQKKIQAEPGPAPKRDSATGKIVVDANGQPVMHPTESNPRWVGTGWTVFNNKGKPVRQFEPFFTDTHQFEFDTRIGVSSILFYDPPGRVVATLHPNHTYEKVVFNPWKQVTWDVNDTVLIDPRTDADIKEITAAYFANLPPSPPAPLWQTWHAQRIGGALGPNEQKAAQKAAAHAETPTTVHLDSLGRTFLSFADNGPDPADMAKHVLFATRVEFDIEGNQRSVRDAIIQNGDPLGRIVMRYDYDMLGNRIHSESMEAGQRWMLHDVVGKPLYSWDSRDHRFRTTYDRLRRPIESRLKKVAAPEFVVEQTFYGDNGSSPNPEQRNLRTRVEKHNDQAGQVVSKAYDFKGNLLNGTRQLAKEYKVSLNWGVAVPLEATLYESLTVYDALNRPTKLTSPDGSKVRPTYNEANLLQAVQAELASDPAGTVTPFVANIDYNAKGQRTRIDYGNGTSITYEYDFLTYRLKQLVTKRDPTKFPDDCKNPPTIGWPGCWLQDLKYNYDPVGNITSIRDDAQQVIFFQNKKVEPSAEYTYDAVYRLTEATGREHLGQNGQPVVPDSYSFGHSQIQHPSDGNAMGTYGQKYVYDAVGNILKMQHRGTSPANPGWTLNYKYEEDSQIEKPPEVTPAKKSNRLSKTNTGGFDGDYDYDLHGNMTKMPHLPIMQWDHHDQLVMTCREVGNPVSAEKTYYVYDSQGQRVRKVTENSVGAKKHERLYLGGFEVYRKYDATGTTVTLERETLHVMDDKQRIAMVERRTKGTEGEARLIRYQLNNHLGTACIELDQDSKVISYEEYFPYGATSYQAVRAGLDTNPKRYRYTGKERDEENGLYYHGARYYASWLGRWTSCDPAELVDSVNVFCYARSRPIVLSDPSGKWSWGDTAGLGAAIAVGVVLTAFSGGILGPVAAGIIAGAAAGATGEIVSAAVDGRPITARNILTSAAVGAAFGGAFSGAGQLLANTQIGQRIAGRIATSAIGQAAARTSYRIATSRSVAGRAAQAAGAAVRQGLEKVEMAGEAAGRSLGGSFAENALQQSGRRAALQAAQADAISRSGTRGAQATLQGELNGQPFSATTRSGVDKSGVGIRAIETPSGRVQAPAADAVPDVLRPLPVTGSNGETFVRGADAEFKLFGHTLLSTDSAATGQLYLGVSAPMCPSCTSNLWNTRAAIPGVRIITDMPSPVSGAAGAFDRLSPSNQSNVAPAVPVLEVGVHF